MVVAGSGGAVRREVQSPDLSRHAAAIEARFAQVDQMESFAAMVALSVEAMGAKLERLDVRRREVLERLRE